MIKFNIDAAISGAPVNKHPLTDDTDGKTIETAVAYNAAGMALKWNFILSDGTATQTAVTPTTAGVYDWTHLGGGMYTIEIPASGGASINNDAVGFGWFTGVATGVLPWSGPIIAFRAQSTNDLFMSAVDTLSNLVTNLTAFADTISTFTVDAGATTSSVPCSALVPDGGTADQFVGRTIVFDKATTTANLRCASAIIVDYSTTGDTFIVAPPLPAAPAAGDVGILIL